MGDVGKFSPESSLEKESGLFSETEKLMAEVIEKGGDMDASILATKRAQLQQHYLQLGVTKSDGSLDPVHFLNFVVKLAQRKDSPAKPSNYPEQEPFSKKYTEIVLEDDGLKEIRGRMGKSPEEYLYGLGIVMANKVSYEVLFENDPIQVDKLGNIQNGRHRSLTREVLNRTGFNTSAWTWIRTESEE